MEGEHHRARRAREHHVAIADRTVDLGGSVLVPPFDAEVVRVAVLADPQGAVFAVNQFEPEGF